MDDVTHDAYTKAALEMMGKALEADPSLHRLLDLLRAGRWVFMPTQHLFVGARSYPGDWTDSLVLLDELNAKAFRSNPAKGCVWKREGTLNDVVDGLLELPPPDASHAPRLVIGPAPTIWAP